MVPCFDTLTTSHIFALPLTNLEVISPLELKLLLPFLSWYFVGLIAGAHLMSLPFLSLLQYSAVCVISHLIVVVQWLVDSNFDFILLLCYMTGFGHGAHK